MPAGTRAYSTNLRICNIWLKLAQ